MKFDEIWNIIKEFEGEEFRTQSGLKLTYSVLGDYLKPSRTNYKISKNDFKKAFDLMPLSGPKEINDICRGPAYIYAILTDKRICN
ncbi:MAG: hypothetical protein K2K50_06455 [Anaeroplasmataceae bacterium]|nr:hypothetical protein [Anaeroplasmataceae bacterium]